MVAADEADATIQQLRELALVDPLGAKGRITALLDSSDLDLARAVMVRLRSPADGRLRQLVARAITGHSARTSLIEIVVEWRRTETDEFALRAIQAALVDDERASSSRRVPSGSLPSILETYRYVSGRLQHRVRNNLPPAGLSVDRLASELHAAGGEALLARVQPSLAAVRDALRQLGRMIEVEEGDEYFEVRPVRLCAWIEQHLRAFAVASGSTTYEVVANEVARERRIAASDFLLDTAFTNLWNNARQAVTDHCQISVSVASIEGSLAITIIDNGPGFPAADVERAFVLQFSTKGGRRRGRGLLEVWDAVTRLGGSAELREIPTHRHRVVLSLPTIEP